MTTPLSRRAVLRRATFITAGAAIGSSLLATPGHAAVKHADPDGVRKATQRARQRRDRVLTGIPSKNGWEMEKVADDHGTIYTRPVPGTPLEGVTVRMGEVETVLVHLIRRFHYEIGELRRGDVVGWRSPGTVRKGLPESNQASGTAVQIRPDHYPAGARGGFFPQQQLVIRDILAELDGVVRWGGDEGRWTDEALFSIDVKPGDIRLADVVNTIRGWQDQSGQGAGSPVDVASRPRREAAAALELRQRKSG
ncbi:MULTISPECIES: hypothetical protein [unclassified Streptomyces]|uniref:hypothetical protein n=1 Tax=unclassified Streptomyces TaxID=2593676 RepID=UPI00225BFA4D|nr:hypothetical protein [Streptomyces sp. NBC_00047]MCX5610899.1 hypothetical protein [Streptomyces sp. NBC_00047]